MVLHLDFASAEDVDCIADIHLAAFKSTFDLRKEVLDDIESQRPGEKAVLVVRETESGKLVSFARWDLPGLSTGHAHLSTKWPDGCRQDCLDDYYEKAAAAKKRVLGDQRCYRLIFIGTLPGFQGRGAGSLLSQWGVARAKAENVLVYLESTIEASSLYRKLGFVFVDGFSMKIPGTANDSGPEIYEEVCMLRTWDEDGMGRWDSTLSISSLHLDYEAGIKPQQVVEAIYDRIAVYRDVQRSVWIYLRPIGDLLQAANRIYHRWPNAEDRPPLWGVPFSVKDSINVAGILTTIGCPALAFIPPTSAPIFKRCIEAGALFVGKTNMEQLATGMTGCRSPFGTLHSTFSKSHIVGGSSSGSAVTVSEGLASFSLGSDTAGSIRVPALYNGVVGFKPTKGTVSARGVAPASMHQDCVSFLALDAADAEIVWKVCEGFDRGDYFAKTPCLPCEQRGQVNNQCINSSWPLRFAFGIPPPTLLKICSQVYITQFHKVVEALRELGGKLIDIDYTPFASANDLLYHSSFILERLTMFPPGWFNTNAHQLHPVTRQVFESALARNATAVDVFRDLHKQAEYKRAVENILTLETKPREEGQEARFLTVMVVPTAPFHPTIEEVGKDPFGINGTLGAFAHFANVLDLTGIAIPCGSYTLDENEKDGGSISLPFGVTILAGSRLDQELLELAKAVEERLRDVGEE